MGKLSATAIPRLLKVPGRYGDGDGLCLLVRKAGQGTWVARLQSDKRRRDYGLGPVSLVSLSEAREKCRAYRRALAERQDPLALGRPPEGAQRLFRETAEEFVRRKFSAAGQKRALGRLKNHAFPKLGKLQLQSIDADTIADCLRPIWMTKPETARKVRHLIIRALRFGLPDGAALIGTLARAIADRLPDQPRGKNFAAIRYAHVPELMTKLEAKKGMGALALRATILCTLRSQMARLATWQEIDWENRVWIVPLPHTKNKREELRVPLSDQALVVLEEAAAVRRAGTDLIFPGDRDAAMSDATMRKCLRSADPAYEAAKATVHGMRSAFKTWARERTSFPEEISEAALEHVVPNPVMAAYRRTTFFDQRVELMRMWGAYCAGNLGAEVVQLADHRA